jgi:hypothetical protein
VGAIWMQGGSPHADPAQNTFWWLLALHALAPGLGADKFIGWLTFGQAII